MPDAPKTITIQTACGPVLGLETERCRAFLGVPYARAGRFRYAEPVERWEGSLDATRFGPSCPQNRAWHEHLEHPVRRFYKREYREGLDFSYSEDCLNLNIYAPKDVGGCPVILFFHGGGFDSGLNWESPFDGAALAERGIVTVFANYRVGPLGYLTHEQIRRETGRDGNFGLDDQLCALRWVKEHIASFGGDGENVTLMGQSAGAISIQYLCLNHDNAGLFRRAVMMSGAGLFPRFALPKPAEATHAYWEQYLALAGCETLDELRQVPLDTLFDAVEAIRQARKDGIYYTMPVVDGALIPKPIDEAIRSPLPMDCWVSCTNNDMYAPVMGWIGARYARQNGAWLCYFDLDAPGDGNAAFHSADLRYVFGTLEKSWRPYGERDYEASAQLMDYLANFARSGDPNGPGLPRWERTGKGLPARALHIGPGGCAMGRLPYGRLLKNMLTKGDPKG